MNGEGFLFDVFDDSGRFIAKIQLAVVPKVWKFNKLYAIEKQNNGLDLIKVFSVSWIN